MAQPSYRHRQIGITAQVDSQIDVDLICIPGGPGLGSDYFLTDPFGTYAPGARYLEYSDNSIDASMLKLDGMIKAARAERVILAGHSFGGAFALDYVDRYHPQRIAALILISWIHD